MSDRLRRVLAERIQAAGGRITFAEYMAIALYDPEDGFFSRGPVGRGAHFVTSPHVSPVFARLLVEQVDDTQSALGERAGFTVVDLGAGDGLLATQFVQRRPDLRVVAVEPAQPSRADEPFERIPSLDALGSFAGLVVANELLDNIPFHRLRQGPDGSVVEVFVGVRGDLLVEIEDEPTVDATPVPGAREWPVAPAVEQIVAAIAATLQRGHVLFFDYGFVAGEDPEPIRGYAGQRLVHDLLAEPGATDITGPVNFDALAAIARAHGFAVHGPIIQRDVAMNLGYRRALADMQRRQRAHEQAGEHRAAIELFGARNEAAMLVEPSGLGGLKVMGLSTPGMPAPRAFG